MPLPRGAVPLTHAPACCQTDKTGSLDAPASKRPTKTAHRPVWDRELKKGREANLPTPYGLRCRMSEGLGFSQQRLNVLNRSACLGLGFSELIADHGLIQPRHVQVHLLC